MMFVSVLNLKLHHHLAHRVPVIARGLRLGVILRRITLPSSQIIRTQAAPGPQNSSGATGMIRMPGPGQPEPECPPSQASSYPYDKARPYPGTRRESPVVTVSGSA
jgi:hypothetical protein